MHTEEPDGLGKTAGMTMAFSFIIILTGFPLASLYIMKVLQVRWPKEKFKQIFGTLQTELELDNEFHVYHPFIFSVRRLIIACVLVNFSQHPLVVIFTY